MIDIWNDHVLYRIADLARLDGHYQDLLKQAQSIEETFLLILETLQEDERILIEDYIAICEDLLYRKAQFAYSLGLADGAK